MPRPLDTSPEAWRAYLEILRHMSGPERVAKAFEMTDAARSIAESGVRHRHPDWSDDQVRDAMIEVLLGAELAGAVRRSRLKTA